MIFSREYVGYLARQTVKQLIEAKVIRTDKPNVLNERVNAGILDELSLEDRINEEVRVILDAYQEEMRRTGASYADMFKKVKVELARKYKAVLSFFDWAYKNGDEAAVKLDYVPLPQPVKDMARQQWSGIKGPDGQPVFAGS